MTDIAAIRPKESLILLIADACPYYCNAHIMYKTLSHNLHRRLCLVAGYTLSEPPCCSADVVLTMRVGALAIMHL